MSLDAPNTAILSALGVLIDTDLGRYDSIREHARTPPLSLQALESLARRHLSPSPSVVRGDIVAMDSLLEALLRHGHLAKYKLYSSPSSLHSLERRVHQHWNIRPGLAEVHPRNDLIEAHDLVALLSPSLAFGEPFRLRELVTSRVLPVIALSHGFSAPSMLWDSFFKICLTPTYACDSIICTSSSSRAAMALLLEHVDQECTRRFKRTDVSFKGTIDVIPLSVDTTLYKPQGREFARNKLKLPYKSFIFLFVGRISPMKTDLLPLLQVMRLLVSDNPRRRLLLVIAGTREEPYATALEAYLRRYSLTSNVRFVCDLSDHDKAMLYSACDILVALADSIQESFGLTPVEAMASGLPQVASDWNGYRDTVVHGETGFLVPTLWAKCDDDLRDSHMVFGPESDHIALGQSIATDLVELKRYLQVMLDEEDLREEMAYKSRLRAEGSFSYKIMSERYEDLIRSKATVASRVRPDRTRDPFLRPSYFATFNSHAATTVDDDCVIRYNISADSQSVQDAVDMARTSCFSPLGIEENVVHATIAQIKMANGLSASTASGNSDCSTMGSVAANVSTNLKVDVMRVRRCIMWLIKNGFAVVNR